MGYCHMMQIRGTWRKPDATGHLRDDDNSGKDYTNLTVEMKLELANASAAVSAFLAASGLFWMLIVSFRSAGWQVTLHMFEPRIWALGASAEIYISLCESAAVGAASLKHVSQ